MAAPRVSLSSAGASRLLCAAAVVLGQAVSSAILMATALYAGYCIALGSSPLSASGALALLPFAGTIVAGRNLHRKLQGRPHWRMAHAWFLGFTPASMLASLEWFKDPMHDIALAFGSRGRWGCSVYDEDGSPVYLLRDSTVPFILFVPILLVAAARWFATRRARVPSAP